jgi:hypothetical protein
MSIQLYDAVIQGDLSTVKHLLESDSKVKDTDNEYCRLIDIVKRTSHTTTLAAIKNRYECLVYLSSVGVPITDHTVSMCKQVCGEGQCLNQCLKMKVS